MLKTWRRWSLTFSMTLMVTFTTVSFLYLAGMGDALDEVSWLVWVPWIMLSFGGCFLFVCPILVWQRRQYRRNIRDVHQSIYSMQLMLWQQLNTGYCQELRDALVLILYAQSNLGKCPCCGVVIPDDKMHDPSFHGKIMFGVNELPCPVPKARALING